MVIVCAKVALRSYDETVDKDLSFTEELMFSICFVLRFLFHMLRLVFSH
jgi:hypothetical protein